MNLSSGEAAALYEEARRRRDEGNVTGAFARYRRLLEGADGAPRAALLEEIGRMYHDACDVLEARRWYAEALAERRAQGDAGASGALLLRLAEVEVLAGEPARAGARFREALAAAEGAADAPLEVRARAGLGQLLLDVGREQEGMREMLRAAGLARERCPAEALPVEERLRLCRAGLGSVRYRLLLEAAADDPALRAELPAPAPEHPDP